MPKTEAQQRQLDSYLDSGGKQFRPAFNRSSGGHYSAPGKSVVAYDRSKPAPRSGGGLFGGLFRDFFDGGGLGQSGDKFQGGLYSGLLNMLGVEPMSSLQAPSSSPAPIPRPAMSPVVEQSPVGVPPSPVGGAGLLGSVGVGAPNITGELGFGLPPMADPSVAQFGPVSPVAMPGLLGSDYNDVPPMTDIGRTPNVERATPEQMAGQPPLATGPAVTPDMPQDPMTEAPALVDAEIPGLGLAFRSLDTRQPASETVRNVRALGPLTTPQMDTQGTLEGLLGNPVAPGVLPPDDTITQPALSFREGPVQRPFGGSTALAFGEQPEVRMSTRGNSPLQIFEGTRAQYDPATGLNISMDFNASANGGARGTEVIIPDDASPELRAAAERFNQGVRAFAAQNGIEDYPIRGVRTRSENGRGVRNTVHVEPFFNDDLEMQELVAANPGAFAEIYREAFGGIDGRLIAPHGVGRDRGAGSPVFKDETSFGEMMARSLLSEPEQPMTANNMPLAGLLGDLSRPIEDVSMSAKNAPASMTELNIPREMGAQRDRAVLSAVQQGNVSPMSLETSPVTVDGRYTQLPEGVEKVVFDVGNAPVMLGNEGVLYPASFDGGPMVAAALGGAAPTRVIVDAGMDQGRRVTMPTQKPGPGMTSMEAAERQSEAIRDKIDGLTFFNKEILADGTFYGGVRDGNRVWQTRPSRGKHSGDYADYSHGVRVVRAATVYPENGEPYQVPVSELYQDPAFARALGL